MEIALRPIINRLAGISMAIGAIATQSTRALEPFAVLQPSDGALGYGGNFGDGVAISQDWVVIGAPADFELEVDSGAAYVFRRVGATWTEHQKLHGLGQWNERFGAWAAFDDDWLVVGSPMTSTFCCSTGRIFIFRRNLNGTKGNLEDDRWELFQVINENLELCCMGGNPAIDNGVIVVGGGPEFNPDTDPGRAYIFEWDGSIWTGPQTIRASDPMPHAWFGSSVTISGSRIAVGAPNAGAVYVFDQRSGEWQEEAKLTSTGANIGASVRLAGPVLVAGNPSQNEAYVFKNEDGNWTLKHRLLPWERGPGQYPEFGNSMAVSGSIVVAAARDQPWAYAFQLVDRDYLPLEALYATEDVQTILRVVTDGRIVVVRDHLYAVGNFDLRDFGDLQNCADSDVRGKPAQCASLDLETDGAVDSRDLPLFLLTFKGPS